MTETSPGARILAASPATKTSAPRPMAAAPTRRQSTAPAAAPAAMPSAKAAGRLPTGRRGEGADEHRALEGDRQRARRLGGEAAEGRQGRGARPSRARSKGRASARPVDASSAGLRLAVILP